MSLIFKDSSFVEQHKIIKTMLTAVNGVYENGHIILEEKPDFQKKMKVIVTFTEEININKKKRQAGVLNGKVWMSDDFNEPLDDLKDYM